MLVGSNLDFNGEQIFHGINAEFSFLEKVHAEHALIIGNHAMREEIVDLDLKMLADNAKSGDFLHFKDLRLHHAIASFDFHTTNRVAQIIACHDHFGEVECGDAGTRVQNDGHLLLFIQRDIDHDHAIFRVSFKGKVHWIRRLMSGMNRGRLT